jgi:3-oxoacyl-[acyl-carrier protein] reductase
MADSWAEPSVDRYQRFTQSGTGRFLVKRLGLPNPPVLRRYEPGQALLDGPALVGSTGSGRLGKAIDAVLEDAGVDALREVNDESARLGAIIFDASGITSTAGLRNLYEFFHPVVRSLRTCGRIVVLGTPPEDTSDPDEATAQRALEGFTRSVAKEIKRGSTTQLLYVRPGAESNVESTLRFLLSTKSAYVSGQVIRIREGSPPAEIDWNAPLAGTVAVVTGAARGIGAATAKVLARDGAHVVCVDRPSEGESLAQVAAGIAGSSLGLDITADDAPERLVSHLKQRHGKLDIVVHNAGVTRDKTLAKMSDDKWDLTLGVNLIAPQRLTSALVDSGVLGRDGRVIGLASISGIAGNVGQTNYATSKAGVIGFVQSNADAMSKQGITINAVAPGFIATPMTAAMPAVVREAGRRMNSMSQAGLPVDVAETVAWLAEPASAGVTGNVVRVCGQSLVGA